MATTIQPPQMQSPAPPPRSRWGRRHRRIAWTLGVLFTCVLAGGLVAWKIHRENLPEEYTPGEASADVTTDIADQAAKRTAAAPALIPRTENKARRSDPLRDPGAKLPAGAPAPKFTDVTREAGLAAFRTFAGKRESQLPEDMGGGAAWGDFDNDGHDDLFLVSAGGPLSLPAAQRAPSMLFRNRGDGTFERVAGFAEPRILGMGAAWGDYNGDGWLDLAVSGYNTLLLYRNDHGKLVRDKRLPSPDGFWTGLSWADYNNDGRADLYVCGYVKYVVDPERAAGSTKQFGLEVPYTLNPASFEAERNLLFRNEGHRFTEVAKQLGVDNPEGRSLSSLWHDFDEDGWLDLYIANDISHNKFFLNRRGRFVDSGSAAWIAEYRGSMGVAAADFDRDGDDDLFISHWVAQQFALYQSLLKDKRRSDGGESALRFTDVAEISGVGQASLQKIGWGAAFADFDSDGWLDLAVANGSTFETKAADRSLETMEAFLFWNDGRGYFHDLAPWNRALSRKQASRGLAVADYDSDGAVDVAIVDLDGGVRLLRNDMPHGNWVEFRLRNRTGVVDGATVIATAGGREYRAAVTNGSYLSQHSRTVHIGLGRAAKVDSIRVRWPGGRWQTLPGVPANRIWEVQQGEAAARMTRTQTVEFWAKQRAGMDAMKRTKDYAAAAQWFRAALAIDPAHEDSRYYLANSLVAQGDTAGAIRELEELTRLSPMSHRGWQRRGVLLALSAKNDAGLRAAEASVQQAVKINPEETGSLLLLSEIALARGDARTADERLRLALRTNSRSVAGLYLQGYAAWKHGDAAAARRALEAAVKARGPQWKPKGSVHEGDVRVRMDAEIGFLSNFVEAWSGATDPAAAYRELHAYLKR